MTLLPFVFARAGESTAWREVAEKRGEKASEPPRELVVDAGVKDESKPKKDTLPPTYRPDIGPERTILDQTKPEGCSCAASPFEYGQLPFGMLCVLLFFGWKRRR